MVRNKRKNPAAVWPETVVGGKYVRLLGGYLRRLRTEEAHGNRRLFLDDVFVTYLLAFFNPTIRSRRTIEDFSQERARAAARIGAEDLSQHAVGL